MASESAARIAPAGLRRRTIEIALPPATTQLRAGIVLQGRGTLWVDDAALEIVD